MSIHLSPAMLREVQLTELELLEEVDRICRKNDIHYNIIAGTMLGAVRHKGFIPWDNDMDIVMPRPDLEKLLTLAKSEPVAPDVRLFDRSSSEHFHYPIVRACSTRTLTDPSYLRQRIEGMGLWVDIFPLDGVIPSRHFVQKPLVFLTLKTLNANIYDLPPEQKSKRFVQKFILAFCPNRGHKYENRLTKLCAWTGYDSSDTVGVLCEEGVTPRMFLAKKDVEDPVLADFEDARLYIPRNADKYLTAQYGSYMELPPEEDRMTHAIHSWFV